MSGDTGRAKIADVVNNRWGWSEIHWSTPDPLDFELDKYTCPIVDEYSIEGSVPDVVGLPAEYHEKTLKQMHDEFSAGAGDLHGELKDGPSSISSPVPRRIQPIQRRSARKSPSG